MPTVPVTDDAPRLLRLLVIIIGFFAFVLIVACLSWGRTLLIPVALALFLTFLLAPVVTFLQRTGLNRTVAIILVVLCAGSSFAGVGWVVVDQVTGLVHDLRRNRLYKQNIKQKLTDLQGISKGGVLEDIQATVNNVMGEIDQDDAAAAPTNETPVVVREESPPLATLQAALAPVLEPLSAAALVIVLVIFMLLDYEDLRNRLLGLVGSSQLTTTTKALADAGQRISRYLLMQFFINGSYGLAVGAGLFFLGVPYAVLWGFLAALLRYVPYVGPWIAAVFPITISVVAFTGWIQPCLVIGLFLLLELGSNMIVEPWLYGQSIGVSQVGLLVVTGFWTWLWGPIGLVLATPLTVCIIVLGRHVPQLRFFDILLGDQPALDPPVIYYQRLLARDQEEATDLVEDYVRTHTLESVYDEVLIPALLLAWRDRQQGVLGAEEEAFILQATRAVVEDLNAVASETENSDHAVSAESGEHTPAPALLFGCPAHHEAEEIIVHMLRHLMQRSGSHVEVMSARTHSTEIATRIAQERPVLAFIATLPGGLPQTRYLCAHIHKEFPALPIVVGYWGSKQTYDKVLVRLRQAGSSYLVTSLLQGRARLCTLIEEAAGRTQTTNLDSQAVEAR